MLAVALCLLASASDIVVGAPDWNIVKRQSGPTNYYSVQNENGESIIRSAYVPPMRTAVLGYEVPEADRKRVAKVKWKWRAQALPVGGDECAAGKTDSAAVVYLTWHKGLRYYTLKYVWSSVGQVGRACDSKRSSFLAQDTVILQSGGPLGQWRSETIDLPAAFRRHFSEGDPNGEAPEFVGIGLMSDGDQTRSPSSADFGPFTLVLDH